MKVSILKRAQPAIEPRSCCPREAVDLITIAATTNSGGIRPADQDLSVPPPQRYDPSPLLPFSKPLAEAKAISSPGIGPLTHRYRSRHAQTRHGAAADAKRVGSRGPLSNIQSSRRLVGQLLREDRVQPGPLSERFFRWLFCPPNRVIVLIVMRSTQTMFSQD